MANEKRLIDANGLSIELFATKCALFNGESEWVNGYCDALQAVLELIVEAPTVDAVEVKHGRWLSVDDSLFPGTKEKCSLCGVHKDVGYVYHYFPNCSAEMDGGNEDG